VQWPALKKVPRNPIGSCNAHTPYLQQEYWWNGCRYQQLPPALRSVPQQHAPDQPYQLKKFFTIITKRILENQENIPNNVYIFTDNILDHIDQGAYTGIAYEDQKGNELFRRKSEELKKTFPEELKKILTENGIDAGKIVIKSGRPNQQELQEIDRAGNWVIIDRHSRMFDGSNALSLAKDLKLPTGDFYEFACKLGLIDIPEEEFNQNLEKVIDEKLGG